LNKFENDWCSFAYSALLRDAVKGEDDGVAAVGSRRLATAITDLERDEYGLMIVPP
jgi:ribosomal protein S6